MNLLIIRYFLLKYIRNYILKGLIHCSRKTIYHKISLKIIKYEHNHEDRDIEHCESVRYSVNAIKMKYAYSKAILHN